LGLFRILLFSGKRKIAKTDKKDNKQIMREFRLRQGRQILAIAVALFLVLFLAVLYKRPDRFGGFSKKTLCSTIRAHYCVYRFCRL